MVPTAGRDTGTHSPENMETDTMAYVEADDRGEHMTYRARCDACKWREDHGPDGVRAIRAATFHSHGFARTSGMFGQERRPDLLCPKRRTVTA